MKRILTKTALLAFFGPLAPTTRSHNRVAMMNGTPYRNKSANLEDLVPPSTDAIARHNFWIPRGGKGCFWALPPSPLKSKSDHDHAQPETPIRLCRIGPSTPKAPKRT